jgi:hypothetical protein
MPLKAVLKHVGEIKAGNATVNFINIYGRIFRTNFGAKAKT